MTTIYNYVPPTVLREKKEKWEKFMKGIRAWNSSNLPTVAKRETLGN